MIRFLEVEPQDGGPVLLLNVQGIHGVKQALYNEGSTLVIAGAEGKLEPLDIKMGYESLKAYLGGMILGA